MENIDNIRIKGLVDPIAKRDYLTGQDGQTIRSTYTLTDKDMNIVKDLLEKVERYEEALKEIADSSTNDLFEYRNMCKSVSAEALHSK